MYRFLLILISALFLATPFNACRQINSPELILLDSLERQLGKIAMNLNIDEQTIASRNQEMQDRMRAIRLGYQQEYSPEMAQKLGRYKAVSKVYQSSLSRKDKMEEELEYLHHQLKALRNSVTDSQLSREQFQEYYSEEKAETERLLEASNELHSKMYAIELEYQRLSVYIEELMTLVDSMP